MTKAQTIIQTAAVTTLDKVRTETVVTALLYEIVLALECGNAVSIPEFGTFHPLWRNETIGRVIQKNITIVVPGHFIPHFEPYSLFKKAIIAAWQPIPPAPG